MVIGLSMAEHDWVCKLKNVILDRWDLRVSFVFGSFHVHYWLMKKLFAKFSAASQLKLPPRKILFRRLAVSGFVVVILLVIFRKSLLGLMANGADYVLRPILGEANTLKIESLVFGLEDKVNGFSAKAPSSADAVFTGLPEGTIGVGARNDSQMSLAPITPLTSLTPFTGEGIWEPMAVPQFPKEIVAVRTVLHVDNARPFAYTALVKMATNKLAIGSVAGTEQPGGPIGNHGVGKVPNSARANDKLIAAFDGGFQYRDGAYGMIVDGKTYVPLRNDLATLLIDKQGRANIVEYHGEKIASDIQAVRQNGPLLVKDGEITPFVEQGRDTWGRTITTSIYTWRSGFGVTKTGDLVFAVGPSLVPSTLAAALKAAGAVNAMQLDINPFWVRFVTFKPNGDGTYTSESLLKNMENGGTSFLDGYQKDFFYIFAR